MLNDMTREQWEDSIFGVVDNNHNLAVTRAHESIKIYHMRRQKMACKLIACICGAVVLAGSILAGLGVLSPFVLLVPAAGFALSAARLTEEG